jgi:hypothetical protein
MTEIRKYSLFLILVSKLKLAKWNDCSGISNKILFFGKYFKRYIAQKHNNRFDIGPNKHIKVVFKH